VNNADDEIIEVDFADCQEMPLPDAEAPAASHGAI